MRKHGYILLLTAAFSLLVIQPIALADTPDDEAINALNKGSIWSRTVHDSSNACNQATAPPIGDPARVAASIDRYIQTNGGMGTPFDGLGVDIVTGAENAGVSPFLIVAIARKESGFGMAGIATHNTYNAFGRTAASGQPSVTINGRNWYKWESWKSSVNDSNGGDEPTLIKNVYTDKGLTTIEQVINKYAPPTENNTNTYVEQVSEWIDQMVALSGDALQCSNAATEDDGSTGGTPSQNENTGKEMAAKEGWTGQQFTCLDKLWTKESGWKERAINDAEKNNDLNKNRILDGKETISETEHDAYGIPQALPGGKMKEVADDWRSNPRTQIAWGLKYIKGRYNTPCSAWLHSQRTGWY